MSNPRPALCCSFVRDSFKFSQVGMVLSTQNARPIAAVPKEFFGKSPANKFKKYKHIMW